LSLTNTTVNVNLSGEYESAKNNVSYNSGNFNMQGGQGDGPYVLHNVEPALTA